MQTWEGLHILLHHDYIIIRPQLELDCCLFVWRCLGVVFVSVWYFLSCNGSNLCKTTVFNLVFFLFKVFHDFVLCLPGFQRDCRGKSQTRRGGWCLCPLWYQQECFHFVQPERETVREGHIVWNITFTGLSSEILQSPFLFENLLPKFTKSF